MGLHLEYLHTTASTNQYAIELLSKSKPPEGTVITAYEQSMGRGQIGSSWESEPGKNLTFSVILYPGFLSVSNQFALTQCLALAVADALDGFISNSLTLKWPNDIYVGNKKLGGMLIQSSINQTQLLHAVVGIGLNVNQEQFLSEAPNPISLKQILGKEVPLNDLMSVLCPAMEKRYLQLRAGHLEEIRRDYLSRLYYFMEDHLYQRPDGSFFNGRIVDVLSDGKLLLVHDGGQEAFGMKELRFMH